jgi:hypothetical protein
MSTPLQELAERIYRIANFAPEDREAQLTLIDKPGLTEVEKVLTQIPLSMLVALHALEPMWQIILADDLNGDYSDLDDSEIAELKGSINDVVQGTKEAAVEYAMKQITATTKEHRDEFCDDASKMVFKRTTDDGGFDKIEAYIDDELFAEVIIRPVNPIRV